jgi:EH_Signature domain
MDALTELKCKLSKTNVQAFEGVVFDHTPLAREIRTLDAWVGSRTNLRPPIDLIIEALFRFARSSKLTGFRQAQLVCYGCIEPFGEEKLRIIDDGRLFPILLTSIGQYRSKPTAFRRCYRGLLTGYFGVGPDDPSTPTTAKENWQLLRGFLRDHLHGIMSRDFNPDWAVALDDHKDLLTDNPCGRYALPLLDGDSREFQEAKQRLDISDASWIVTRLLIEQIDRACSSRDSNFLRYVPRMLIPLP